MLSETKPVNTAVLRASDAKLVELLLGENVTARFFRIRESWIGDLARVAADDPSRLEIQTRTGGIAVYEFETADPAKPLRLELKFAKKDGRWRLQDVVNLTELFERMAASK